MLGLPRESKTVQVEADKVPLRALPDSLLLLPGTWYGPLGRGALVHLNSCLAIC